MVVQHNLDIQPVAVVAVVADSREPVIPVEPVVVDVVGSAVVAVVGSVVHKTVRTVVVVDWVVEDSVEVVLGNLADQEQVVRGAVEG